MENPTSTSGRCQLLAALDLTLAIIDPVAIDSGERLLAVGQYRHPQQGVAVIDLATRAKRWQSDWSYSTADGIDSLAFSTDGARLWVGLSGGSLRCHAVADGRLLKQTRPSPGDSVDAVRLSRDARYAVISGRNDANLTGWSGGVSRYDSFAGLIAADAPELVAPVAEDHPLVRAIVAASPGPNTLLRFRDAAPLAYSPDGALELVSQVKGHEAAPLLFVRPRSGGAPLDTLTFRRPGDFALCAAFTDDGARFWVGTQSGRLFSWSLNKNA